MNRRTFLNATGGTVAALGVTQPANADDKKPAVAGTPAVVVPAAEGTYIWAMGGLVIIKAPSKLTGGAYAMHEGILDPGQGPPLHTHTKEDETMYLVSGELDVYLGDKKFKAKAGDFVHMARDVPHRFKNVGDKPAHVVMTYAPGGFEQWFFDVGTQVEDRKAKAPEPKPEDIRKAVAAAERYGVHFAKE